MTTNNSTNTPELTLNGQTFIGSTGANPVAATLTAGVGVSITNGAGSITIASTGGGGFTTVDTVASPQALAAATQYIADTAGLLTFNLPAVAAVGDTFRIIGKGAGGWTVAQGAGQQIHIGNVTTTAGAGGSLSSSNQWDCVTLVCITANTTFAAYALQGNLTNA